MPQSNPQIPNDAWETDGGSGSVPEPPIMRFTESDEISPLRMVAKIKAHPKSLNGRLRESLKRFVAIVTDAYLRLSGAKVRRWVSAARQQSWTLWKASRRKRETCDLLSDADLYTAAQMTPGRGLSGMNSRGRPSFDEMNPSIINLKRYWA